MVKRKQEFFQPTKTRIVKVPSMTAESTIGVGIIFSVMRRIIERSTDEPRTWCARLNQVISRITNKMR
ncbi:MAG: hypothetical protein DME26_06155 [Verrucomicrobia bacterium]|nr:MAG: hypothetical protein DME26_06155 [Verrucomicrobiota bacterium]